MNKRGVWSQESGVRSLNSKLLSQLIALAPEICFAKTQLFIQIEFNKGGVNA